MTLHDIVEGYIDHKHSLGMRYRSQAAVLRAFDRAMGDIAVAEVKPESVLAFIAGTGPITARWIENHRVLGGFYRYAVGRGPQAVKRIVQRESRHWMHSMNGLPPFRHDRGHLFWRTHNISQRVLI